MNHIMYADDICLMTPSPASLQELIDICHDFSVQNYISIFQLIQIILYLRRNHISYHVLFCVWII